LVTHGGQEARRRFLEFQHRERGVEPEAVEIKLQAGRIEFADAQTKTRELLNAELVKLN